MAALGASLLVFVSLEPGDGCVRLCGLSCGAAFLLGMFLLRDSSALQIEQSIHGALAVPQDAAQFPPSPIPGAENLPERNGLTRRVQRRRRGTRTCLRGRRGSPPCPSDRIAV